MQTEPWVSLEEVTRHLNVSKDTIYRWIRRRGLPASKVGGLWKFRTSEVDAWVEGMRGKGEPEQQ